MANPFYFGGSVYRDQFIDREDELNRIADRILNRGQSTALVGQNSIGKTSILRYLMAPGKRAEIFGSEQKKMLFSFIDAQTLDEKFSQSKFWERAFHSLNEMLMEEKNNLSFSEAYLTCKKNSFGTYVIDRLLFQLEQAGWHLVLLIDEFDSLLYHPVLNKVEFFGSIRSLASLGGKALSLVIASKQSLSSLNRIAKEYTRGGSPFFNFFDEITLMPFPGEAVSKLLSRARDRFSDKDNRFITTITGSHPYLLQAAASELWYLYENDNGMAPEKRREKVAQKLLNNADWIMQETWNSWSEAMRYVFSIAGLAQTPTLLPGKSRFNTDESLSALSDFGPELRNLKRQGFIQYNADSGGWQIIATVFLWWLAEKLVCTLREEKSLEEWLKNRDDEAKSILNEQHKDILVKCLQWMKDLLKEGITTFIKATIEGLVK